ncbi:MAG: Tol-Pal system protein TolB [Proteobacteria bacterium]|nr:Tol-Pal system protein TolB [Pseudomonadota bacterium]
MSLRVLFAALVALAIAASLPMTPARADIVVDVNQGQIQPLPISIAPFGGEHGADIAQVVGADLERSGYFRIVDPSASSDKGLNVGVVPLFPAWRQIGAQALVSGGGAMGPDGRLGFDYRLWDVNGEKPLDGQHFVATPENWRRVAHKIADAIYTKLTGYKGYFDTRVVFVAESGPKTHRKKLLTIMDQDGANPLYLSDGSYQVMTPRYSSNSQEVVYMALGDNFTRIYLFNIETGRQELLTGKITGLVSAPRFSPDGNRVAFSVTRGGNSDIWLMDLRTRTETRLTVDPGIDTSPSFSPDGRQIVFNSDRSGSPQLYVMNTDGSGVRRLSQGGGRYNTPVWSPTGELIAFTKQDGGRFSIGVMNPDGSGEKILSTSYFEEGPTWAPNGRYIMFHREAAAGDPRLWMVDVTGRVERPAPYSQSGSDPAWSPLLD